MHPHTDTRLDEKGPSLGEIDTRLGEIARLSAELHAEGKDFSVERGQLLPPRLDTEREHTPRDGLYMLRVRCVGTAPAPVSRYEPSRVPCQWHLRNV